MEFVRSNNDGNIRQQQQYGLVRVVECTHLKILGEVPFPPWAAGGSGSVGNTTGDDGQHGRNGKYPLSLYNFVNYMVHHDRLTRPNIHEVAKRFGDIYLELVGERWMPYDERRSGGFTGVNDEFDSLVSSRDFV